MIFAVAQVALLVREYEEAIAFYRDILGFTLVEDTALAHKRWVRLRLIGGPDLLLSRAVGDQLAYVGRQAGGRVFLYLHTDDLDADHARLATAGVGFTEPPHDEPFGRVAVFEDLYGNRIDLIEPRS